MLLNHWGHPMIAKNVTWNVTSLNGAEPFDVTGSDLEEAVCTALIALGWTISPSLVKSEPNDEHECPHCGRVYDDSDECLSDDCPSKDEFITSQDLLVLAKDQSLELELSLNGFLTRRFLSAEHQGIYSHKGGNGDVSEISAEDFLRIYPVALGKVWRVVRKIPKMPAPHRPLVDSIKDFFAKCIYLATYSPAFYLG